MSCITQMYSESLSLNRFNIIFCFLYVYSDIIRTGKYVTTETLLSHHAMMSMLQISTYPVIDVHYSFCAT